MQDRETGDHVTLTEQELGQAVKHLLIKRQAFSVDTEANLVEGPVKVPYTGTIVVNTPEFKATRKFIEKKRRQAKKGHK